MNVRVCVLLLFCLAWPFSFAFARWDKKPEFRWMQLYRWDRHFDTNGIHSNRFSLGFSYLDGEEKPLFKLIPFFEMRRNYEANLWERKELGLEIGKDILPWLYLSESIQRVWKNEEWFKPQLYQKQDTEEAKTKLVLSRKFFEKNSFHLKGFFSGEYVYDIQKGRSMRDEVVAGISAPLGKHWEAGLNWRHIDRIGYFDTDTFEAFTTLVF